ncbi:MAG: signal peptidase I [Candidatus Sumerlaeaceae bacterium]
MARPERTNPDGELSPLDPPAPESTGILSYLREWIDALVIAFVLAMFIRTFVVELFKIPSGSMSPTLLGDFIAEGPAYDESGTSAQFLLIKDRRQASVQVFRKQTNGYWHYDGRKGLEHLTASQSLMLRNELHLEEHRIFVNKFAYWFDPPKRGDIIVFRVPFKLNVTKGYERNGAEFPVHNYLRSQSTYVKRCVGLPDEHIEIRPDKHVYIDGQKLSEPEAIAHNQYSTSERTSEYDVTVPEGHVIALGDNSDNSADSRYWGPLPIDNLRGRAFLRYWPIKKLRFLNKAD